MTSFNKCSMLLAIRNQFVVSGGSYGGTYVPHIATVIHERNLALAAGKGQPGAVHVNLESLMVSNPMSVSIEFIPPPIYFSFPHCALTGCDFSFHLVPANSMPQRGEQHLQRVDVCGNVPNPPGVPRQYPICRTVAGVVCGAPRCGSRHLLVDERRRRQQRYRW